MVQIYKNCLLGGGNEHIASWSSSRKKMDILTFIPQINDFDGAYDYLKERNVLHTDNQPPVCTVQDCGRPMGIVKDAQLVNDGCKWRCPKRHQKTSIRSDSFFESSNLPLPKLIVFVYLWAHRIPLGTAAVLSGISQQSLLQWYVYFRDVCSHELVNSPIQLGGPGRIVEIDESLFVKAKYNRGHALHRPQRWVFGIYDVQTKVGVLVFVDDRSADTLLPLIRRYTLPGTTIHSDEWRAYTNIVNLPVMPRYVHHTVNHSRNFVDPVTGACTNRVEAMWKRAKSKFKEMNGTTEKMVPAYLDEFMWRQRHDGNALEAFWRAIQLRNRWW